MRLEVCAGCGALGVEGHPGWLSVTLETIEAQVLRCCSPDCVAVLLTERLPPLLVLDLLDGAKADPAPPNWSASGMGAFHGSAKRAMSSGTAGITTAGQFQKRCTHCSTIAVPLLAAGIAQTASMPTIYVDSPTCLMKMREYILGVARAASEAALR